MTSQNSDNHLVFLPLGGAGEIGMNLNLYGLGKPEQEDWIMVDLGVTFADPTQPGVDVIMPDPSYIADRKDQLLALVLTHAHEDHLGAVQYLWPRLKCPIYATPFTASILKRKLSEVSWGKKVPITVIELGSTFDIGPFNLELITLTHSIPEPNAIAIRTEFGTVLHTGDWKFDPDPVIGEPSDLERLREIGDDGVLAMVCDSTNVLSPGSSGSEGDLKESLTRIIGECTTRVAVACFASNVARLQTIHEAATANGRDVVLAGRSLYRMVEAAKETGYMPKDMVFIDEGDAGFIPRERTCLICTGSQGEHRAALARIAANTHPRVSIEEGDTVIFSSRVIPGNEVSIGQLQNQLATRGINIITWQDDFVHVSGHPARDELMEMYQLVRPQVSVPVHGETRHLIAHTQLAKECQVKDTVLIENGMMASLTPGNIGVIDHVPSGRLAYEGKRLVPLDGELVRIRKRALFNGFCVVTVVLDHKGRLYDDPQISDTGLLDPDDDDLINEVYDAIEDSIERLSKITRDIDEAVIDAVKVSTRKAFRKALDKKPTVEVHLVRLETYVDAGEEF